MSEDIRNVIIIGGGPAGYTSAIYTSRGNLNPLVLAGYQAGGQLMLTTEIENFPGFPEGILGPKLMEDMRNQALRFGAEIINEDVTEVDLSKRPFTVKTYKNEYKAHSVIIATGAVPRMLGLENEERLIGGGVSTCATCDGALFKDKVVAVVGGGDTAMEEASYLTGHASKVYIIHRRDEFRASKIMSERVKKNPKIEIIYNAVVSKLNSKKEGPFIEKLVSLELTDTKTGDKRELPVDGMFLAIGHIPKTDIVKDFVELDDMGYIVTKSHTMTSVEGVFAAGDVTDHRYRQAITAAGDGARAAKDVELWLGEVGVLD